ncbi:hypothetical protein [Sinorhizobium prairiense]|uniref:hypothetical protein n=1 Tax=unclassified Sinorhizobium TaxID=2613772 RepID=UPI0023D88737|nr:MULTISPECIES: hypothetical protein [unclassified Sinorhizobium]WEJ16704.1 hypothetical protein N0Q91_09140 [Sinorhizobium sp. K101]WEJ38577.1 hypothetical protein N0R80_11155 [Sinorhizobium sp. C101]
MPIVCIGFLSARGDGPLRGHGTFHIPRWRLRLHDCACFSGPSGDWIALPSKPRRTEGKDGFTPCVSFDDADTARDFGRAALAALDAYRPDWRGR